MISEWGFDGASAQSRYKQKFVESDCDDSSIFLTSLVPIVIHVEKHPEKTYWENIKTSSTTLCRPLRLEFIRESEEHTLQIKREIDEETQPTIINTEGYCLEIFMS